MKWKLLFSDEATFFLQGLEKDKSKKSVLKQTRKILGFMETNLRHPSLHTHKFTDIECALGDVFESYIQNRSPGAHRIFWAYGPKKGELYILSISPHP